MRVSLTDRERCAYLAGIIDGEGCIAVMKEYHENSGSTFYRPRVYITNTNRDVIEWIAENFGGFIFVNRPEGNRKISYMWHIHTVEQISKLIHKIYPFLIIKKKQAQTLLFLLNKDPLETGEEQYEEMKRLNRKGNTDGLSEDVRETERHTS
jgi:hypothetical protein